jgi:hypothetical protein
MWEFTKQKPLLLLSLVLLLFYFSYPARASDIFEYVNTDATVMIHDYDVDTQAELMVKPTSTTTLEYITFSVAGTCTLSGTAPVMRLTNCNGITESSPTDITGNTQKNISFTFPTEPELCKDKWNGFRITVSACSQKPRIFGASVNPYSTSTELSWEESDVPTTQIPYFYVNEYQWDTTTSSLLYFDFPLSGWVLDNSEWNDWELFYKLHVDDVGAFNILMVHYTDSHNKTTTDWDIVASTTNLTNWVIDRSVNLPDGIVSSQARLTKIDDCTNYYDDNCTWTDVALTDILYWTASSTGYTKFENPYELPNFEPASTTASSTEEAGWIGQIWLRFKNVFPLSLGFQLSDLFHDLATNPNSSLSFNIGTILPAVVAAQVGTAGSSTLIFSTDVWNTGLPFWETTILPTLNYLVYIGFLILIIYILWPRAKNAVN